MAIIAEEEARKELDKIARHLALYSIGFIRLTESQNAEDGVAAGTGTLVSIGSVKGILTAAHVLNNLPKSDPIGILRIGRDLTRIQNLRINLLERDPICFMTANEEPETAEDGAPDIGFLKLEAPEIEAIGSTHSFYNLDRERDPRFLAHDVESPIGEQVFGVVHERTHDMMPARPHTRLKQFNTLAAAGQSSNWRHVADYDICDFKLDGDDSEPSPYSFAGMSGGPLWRLTGTKPSDGEVEFITALAGVIFWQSDIGGPEHRMSCHGIESIRLLAQRVRSEMA
jgi:hypothetical protein